MEDNAGFATTELVYKLYYDLRNQINSGGALTSPIYQAWMETLPDYDPDADDQAVVRDHNGVFRCVIVNRQ